MAPTAVSDGTASSKEERLAQFDASIAYTLSLWPALSLTLTTLYGSTNTSEAVEKRALFAGAISDLFAQRPQTDEQDLEEVLLQVMEDEFEAVIEDTSEREVAGVICRCIRECERGDFAGVKKLESIWKEKRGLDVNAVQGQVDADDDSGSGDSEDDEDEDGDIDMDGEDVSRLVDAKTRVEPEVDEDGFTKVVGRRKR